MLRRIVASGGLLALALLMATAAEAQVTLNDLGVPGFRSLTSSTVTYTLNFNEPTSTLTVKALSEDIEVVLIPADPADGQAEGDETTYIIRGQDSFGWDFINDQGGPARVIRGVTITRPGNATVVDIYWGYR